ncbi:MAG: lamin tail domain-containing protein [Bacteroidales bacterium]|nr:lamin tail domain-containing protein [Bacteroidales bacterium]
MKKIFVLAPAFLFALAGCVKDLPYEAPAEPEKPEAPAKVVINEIDCGNKKIEIYNAGSEAVDIAGYVLQKDSDTWTIPAGKGNIAANGFLVFTAKNADPNEGPSFGISGTKGFVLTIFYKDGATEVDKVDNTGGAVQVPDGQTWGRKTDGGSEWVLFDGGTIGASNGAPAKVQVFINEVNCGTKEFEIYNGGSNDVDIAGYTFTKDGKDPWTVPAGKGKIPAKGYLVFVAKNADASAGPSFGLSGTKGFILCMYKSDEISDANLVDKIDNSATAEGFKTVDDGKSLGRKTDGADEWVIFDNPTIGSANK